MSTTEYANVSCSLAAAETNVITGTSTLQRYATGPAVSVCVCNGPTNLRMGLSCTFWLATRHHGNHRRRTVGVSRCDDDVVFLRHNSHYIPTTAPIQSILRPLNNTVHITNATTHTGPLNRQQVGEKLSK